MEIKRNCEFCKSEFVAQRTNTRYCSLKCNSKHYKAKSRKKKIDDYNTKDKNVVTNDLDTLKTKEFLTAKEVSVLLNCSIRSVYYFIDNGSINAINLGSRMTRIKRSDIDGMFKEPQHKEIKEVKLVEVKDYDFEECLTINEALKEYNVSSGALYGIIKRNNIPKKQKGKFVYVPKELLDKLFNK
jgi:excisionase family DNA binding protein